MKKCNICGAENEDSVVFCTECGAKFEADAPAEAAAPAPADPIAEAPAEAPAEATPVAEAPAEETAAPAAVVPDAPAVPEPEAPAPEASAPAAPAVPETPVTPADETIAPAAPRKKKLIPAIIAAAVVVVLAVSAALAAVGSRDLAQLFGGKSYAKNYVITSLKKSFAEAKASVKLSQEIYKNDTIVEEASIKLTDNQEIFDKLYELAGLSESDFPSLAGASVVFKGMMKKDLSEMAANVAVSILPGKTVNGVFAFDEKNFIFGIPEILGGEIFSSPRTDSYGEDVLAGLGEIDLSSLYNTDFYDSLLEDLETETLALFESLDYTVEGNYTVSVNNGKTVKLDRIDTYISAKRLTEFARDVLVRLQNNKELEDWYNDYMQTLDPYAEDYKGVMADLIETLEDELGYIEEEVGGIKLGFLVNKSNKDSGMVTEAIVDDEVTAEIIAAYVPGTGYEFAVKAPNDMRVSLYGDYDKNGSGYKGTASVAVDMGMLVTVDLGTYRYDKAGTELVLDLGKILSIPELADIAPQITGMLDELGIDSKGLKLRFAVKVKDLSTTISLESGKDALITLAVSLGNDNEKIEPKPTREFNDMDEAAEYIADYLLENEDALMEKLEEYLGITPELYEQLTALFAAEPDDLDPTIDVESTFGLGAWNEDRTFFFNSWSEIWFTVPNGFTVGSEEQMLGFMGLSYDDYLNSDLTYDEFVLEQAPGVYYDAYLVSKDGADIQIQYEDISGYGLDSSTLEELADIIAANYGDVQRLGAEGVVLGGLDYTHVSYTVNKNGTDIYLDFYLRRVGDYLVYMTLAGYTAENETQEFLNLIF